MSAKPLTIGTIVVEPGRRCDTEIVVSESYSGLPVVVPVTVWRASAPGPTGFITAAVHGDELNGTGIVRELLLNQPFELTSGSLILAPVINMLGLDRHQRYLPDRRDLNRSFPGDAHGSLARRFANAVFQSIVKQCDFGIDLHTAAVRRTNFPNVRADLTDPNVRRLAYSLGIELIINKKGPVGSLRRAACNAGCPTVILEAGEVWKIEPSVVECGLRSLRNALIDLGMVEGRRVEPSYQVRVDKTKWVRAEVGGMLQFHVAPGDVVEEGQSLVTKANLYGGDQEGICSPADAVVIGLTTLPTVGPGDAVCHLAVLKKKSFETVRKAQARLPEGSLHERLRDDLSTSVAISEPGEGSQRPIPPHGEPRTDS
ncbi:MAG: succinylglutamate desuccinylase/aspartoacylase family protein [Phycisphaerae bacterium]|jgi:hypothetical protein